MDRHIILDNALDQHEPHSQRFMAVETALKGVFASIDELAKYGHVYHLAEGSTDEPMEWPKMVYQDGQDGNGKPVLVQRTVDDEDELKALGDGWRLTP